MSFPDSALDPAALDKARRLLAPPTQGREGVWKVLAAAAFAAVSALSLAAATILAPPAWPQPAARKAESATAADLR